MKKLFSLFVALICVLTVSAQSNQIEIITLMHNGTCTQFNKTQLQAAHDAAVDGDTIFLTKGTFSGSLTISKKITIQGVSGTLSFIDGTINVNMPNNSALTQTLLWGIKTQHLYFNNPTQGVVIKNCQVTGTCRTTALISNIEFDRCWFGLTYGTDNMKETIIRNSYINYLGDYCRYLTLVNCDIKYLCSNYNNNSCNHYPTLINCFLETYYSYNSNSFDGYAQNCVIGTNIITSNATLNNCIRANTKEGYNGYDETPIGYMGGTTPYTLIPETPKVTDGTITVNHEAQTVSLSLQVTAQ